MDKIIKDNLYKIILEKLGREPNETELRLFSAQWSEHCGYLHSKELLKREFQNTMEENAGYVKIDDWYIVFKVESHNHPSAIEPYQGAATGIGGIVRDIIAMGAYPIALLDSLRFGPLNNPASKNIFEGVVNGISDYGNSIGVPTVAGETYFCESFTGNPLINVMCVGKAKKEDLSSSIANGNEISLVYVGGKTGRDGIHGASFASKKLEGKDQRPSVQIGDPFTEKNLIEATMEILKLGETLASQDMGAAGILSSSSEMAIKSGKGCNLNLDNVPMRETDMEAWEIMLSESQERMLFAVKKGKEEKLKNIAEKYYLDFAVIGELVDNGEFKIFYKGEEKANLPIELLVDSPSLYRKVEIEKLDMKSKMIKIESENTDIFLSLLKDPNFSDKSWVYRQYDHKVGTNTVITPGSADAAVIWLKGSNKGIGLTIDGNPLYVSIDPYNGTKNVVYEAARNLVCVGARPLGITDNLNFGNPEKDLIMWQFEESIKGIKSACNDLNIPVTGGNVSFYNESKYGEIPPSPVIGMVGEVDNIYNVMTFDFKEPTDRVYLVGKININKDRIGGSYYLKCITGKNVGNIDIADPKFEIKLHEFVLTCIGKKIINAAHDVSDGGLVMALTDSLLKGDKGFRCGDEFLNFKTEDLFGENQSRIIVTVPPEKEEVFIKETVLRDMPVKFLGEVMPEDSGIDFGFSKFDVNELKELYFSNIEKHMES